MYTRTTVNRDSFGTRSISPAVDATLRYATGLVLNGMSGVTIIVPRTPGVLNRARHAAREAGVLVRADNVASTTITMRFSADSPKFERPIVHQTRRSRRRAGSRKWSRLFGWL